MWWPKVVRTWAEEAPMAKEKSLSTLYIWKSLCLIAARFIISDFGRLIFNAGPYAAIGIAGKGKYTDEWEGTSMKFDLFSGDEAVLKRFDAGVQAGFAYEIKHIGFSYTFGYGLLKPFKEWNKEWGATPHNISHNFGLKYIF